MRSKPVTQSNGVVVRKSSIRNLPNDPLKLLPQAEGVSLGIIGGVVPPVLQILTLFETKKFQVSTRFQT